LSATATGHSLLGRPCPDEQFDDRYPVARFQLHTAVDVQQWWRDPFAALFVGNLLRQSALSKLSVVGRPFLPGRLWLEQWPRIQPWRWLERRLLRSRVRVWWLQSAERPLLRLQPVRRTILDRRRSLPGGHDRQPDRWTDRRSQRSDSRWLYWCRG